MKKVLMTGLLIIIGLTGIYSQGYKIGDVAGDFKLKNVDGELVSLYDFKEAKQGAVIIFTCNHCPYAKAYEDRIIELNKKFKLSGYPVIAINPNDPELFPDDSFEKMVERSKEKGFTFSYLFDEKQEIYKMYGATRTPHIYLLNKDKGDFIVEYIGTIDDNYKDQTMVQKRYLANAVESLIRGEKPNPAETKAIGCAIKAKK
jgi:peroxiredoxin